MAFLLSLALILSASSAVLAQGCLNEPFPPGGTDIVLVPTDLCLFPAFYAQETSGVCSNGPTTYSAGVAAAGFEIVEFEVISNKSCTIFSHENCEGDEVAFVQGRGSVSLNTTAVESVICF